MFGCFAFRGFSSNRPFDPVLCMYLAFQDYQKQTDELDAVLRKQAECPGEQCYWNGAPWPLIDQ
jgi:hypothetical protein